MSARSNLGPFVARLPSSSFFPCFSDLSLVINHYEWEKSPLPGQSSFIIVHHRPSSSINQLHTPPPSAHVSLALPFPF